MQPTPNGWLRFSSSVVYDDARAAIKWLCEAFGFEVRLVVESSDGKLVHSELAYGEGVVMIAQAGARPHYVSPRIAGGNTQSIMVFVDDVEAHAAHAVKHGARVFEEMRVSDYGKDYWSDRSYGAVDLEGHHWWFTQRLATHNPRWAEVRNKLDKSDH